MPSAAKKKHTHWLFSSQGGRPIVVIEADNEDIARERMNILRHQMHIPDGCTITRHSGWSRCSWFSSEWFSIYENTDLELLEVEDFSSYTHGGRPPQ